MVHESRAWSVGLTELYVREPFRGTLHSMCTVEAVSTSLECRALWRGS